MTLANRALEKEKLVIELESLTKGMDVPVRRGRDFKWLLRNLAIRNIEHPDFKKALALSKRLYKMSR